MNLTLSFVEYDAINSIRNLRPVTFTLLSTARLGTVGNDRTWVLGGDCDAFEALNSDISDAMERFLRVSVSAALSDVAKGVRDLLDAGKPVQAPDATA